MKESHFWLGFAALAILLSFSQGYYGFNYVLGHALINAWLMFIGGAYVAMYERHKKSEPSKPRDAAPAAPARDQTAFAMSRAAQEEQNH